MVRMSSVVGFGPIVVQVAAMDIAFKNTSGITSFLPSIEWCRWFLRLSGYVVRRKTGHRYQPQQVELQDQIHARNLDRIAFLKSKKGLLNEDIIGGDEFGCHLFPGENELWAQKGAKHAESSISEDKRQFTGNMYTSANGYLILLIQIWGGKTSNVLPKLEVRTKQQADLQTLPCASDAIALQTFSDNHWNNQTLKLEELSILHRAKVARQMKRGMTLEQATNHLQLVLLDCWPVNLTEITKLHVLQNCPGMELMFIPAGGTGRYQINDTDLHKPFKDVIRFEACTWYRGMLRALKADVVAGNLTEANFIVAVSKLMSMGTLRDKAPEWAHQAIKQLTKPGIDRPECPTQNGANIIKYGWYRIYLKHVDSPDFQAAAILRIEAREAA